MDAAMGGAGGKGVPLSTPGAEQDARQAKEAIFVWATATEGLMRPYIYMEGVSRAKVVASYSPGHQEAFCGNPEGWHPELPSPVWL